MKDVSWALLACGSVAGAVLMGLIVSCAATILGSRNCQTAVRQAPAWSYTINGQSFDYATQCWTENGTLLCDAEDGTRLKVDSYTPMYWEGQE